MDSNPNYWWNIGPYFGEVYGGGTTYSGPAAASGGNQVRVFARGTDSGNQMWMNWKWASGHYQGWYEALPNGATPDSPAAASDANGNYYVAVRGTNNLIYSFRGTWTQVGNGSTYLQPAIGYTPHGLCIGALDASPALQPSSDPSPRQRPGSRPPDRHVASEVELSGQTRCRRHRC
jgi:hypothetical protein